MLDLKTSNTATTSEQAGTPLAERMRPSQWDEFVDQPELVGEKGILRRMVDQGALHSFIIWGPPGSGKTTLARLIARALDRQFFALSAVMSGVKDLRQVVEEARILRRQNQLSILFIDEIHRFNRAQQDAILPAVERGDVTLIGATTENPSFEVNRALLSRCRVYGLVPLTVESLITLLDRAQQTDSQLVALGRTLNRDTLQKLAELSMGDARRALNLLETILLSPDLPAEKDLNFEADVLRFYVQQAVGNYDKSGDNHYDTISALHKSIRNSDPDAALYWLGRMLESGDDPLYVARRLIRAASEDIGLADNRALQVALSAHQVVERIGMPEGELALAQAALFLAMAPKSNSVYRSYGRVKRAICNGKIYPVPHHLRNAVTQLDRQTSAGKPAHGEGYLYAHDFAESIANMVCLPDELAELSFYEPVTHGSEATLWRQLDERRARLKKDTLGQRGDKHDSN